jgi:predicted DNA-binding transcriptional regulator YafY
MTLLTKHRVTATELAKRYNISTRSVYRYIDELNVSGIPIDMTRGRYGGISISDTFKLPSGYFTRDEYTSAINALSALCAQVSDDNALSALEKLKKQQKSESIQMAVCGNIIVDSAAWGDTGKFSTIMQICEQAVNESRSLQIDYISREGEHSKRIIDPHVLIFKGNVWYTYAFCHTKQAFRTFKIGRIKKASFTGKKFVKTPINKSDIPLNFYYQSEQLVEVTLQIDKQIVADVEEWIGIDSIEPKGRSLTATVKLPDDDTLITKLLSFGGNIKVLSPKHIQEKLTTAATQILQSYTT